MGGHVLSIFWPMKLQSSLSVVGNYLRNHEYDSRQPTLGMMRLVVHLSTGILWGTSVGGDFVPVTQYHWLAL
jgi:hypothetical protein